jgi:hypothetical protein
MLARKVSAHTTPNAPTTARMPGIGSPSTAGGMTGRPRPCRTCSIHGRKCTTRGPPRGETSRTEGTGCTGRRCRCSCRRRARLRGRSDTCAIIIAHGETRFARNSSLLREPCTGQPMTGQLVNAQKTGAGCPTLRAFRRVGSALSGSRKP